MPVTQGFEPLPRLPLKASVDLTYRCNNRCRHCWLWLAEDAPEERAELTTDEWREVVDQARALGTREWVISGGEPLLRPDFAEIFEYATAKSLTYSLNTNGTLITPAIARLLRRTGNKMVAVYGATADVYDDVTRNPGGFEALLRGLTCLREVGAGFTMQLIPMRDNWHQWDQMLEFAQSWSRRFRVGAPWLFKSACGSAARNAEIARQRLAPADVVALDRPSLAYEEWQAANRGGQRHGGESGEQQREADTADRSPDDRLYAACIARRRDFHVDPYGGMSFCGFVKDPALRRDLRVVGPLPAVGAASARRAPSPVTTRARGIAAGAVAAVWEESIPSLAGAVRGTTEYFEGCGACDLRSECRWCDVFGYLEHGRHGAKIDYLCAVARANREYKETWVRDNRRYFEIAGITLQVESDLPFAENTFDAKFASFAVPGPGDDIVSIRQHFGLPERDGSDGEEVYRRPPWAIYRLQGADDDGSWVYQGIAPRADDPTLHRIAVFSSDHTRGELYNDALREQGWRGGGLGSLTMFPTDQILLARLLADRDGCLLHSGGMLIDGHGFLFVGHSDAGKSTTMQLVRSALGKRAEILCDDRNIVRFWPRGFAGGPPGFYVHGTWSHGDVADVSSAGAPLRALLFLEQSSSNEIVPLVDRRQIWQRLLATLIRPMVTADWWRKEMDVLERLVAEAHCYTMRFDKRGAIVPEIEGLAR